jgi:hypothetical protein
MPGPVAGKTQWRLIRQAPFIRLAETVSTVPSATPGTLLSSIARAPASGRSRHPSDARYGEPLIAVQISSRVTGGRLCCACASVLLGIASVLAAALYNWLLLIGAAVGALAWFVPELVGGGGDITQRTLIDGATLSALSLAFLLRFGLGAISYAAATPGGLFAPMLVLGTQLGLFFGILCRIAFPGMAVDTTAFAVVGMGPPGFALGSDRARIPPARQTCGKPAVPVRSWCRGLRSDCETRCPAPGGFRRFRSTASSSAPADRASTRSACRRCARIRARHAEPGGRQLRLTSAR